MALYPGSIGGSGKAYSEITLIYSSSSVQNPLSSVNNGDKIMFVADASAGSIGLDGVEVELSGRSDSISGYYLYIIVGKVIDNTKSLTINASYIRNAALFKIS